jgi:hypothetical protein
MRQVKLRRYDQEQIVWVDRDDEIEVGSIISLKGEKEKWKVIEIYEPDLDKQEINRNWKVGGL